MAIVANGSLSNGRANQRSRRWSLGNGAGERREISGEAFF